MRKFKEKLLAVCKTILREKMNNITETMLEISDSMTNETKSSAGDKHETARARMQSEHEKLSYMLSQLADQYKILERIDLNRSADSISSESLVVTDKETFFLSIPVGKFTVGGRDIYGISAASPIGQKLIGLKVQDKVLFNGKEYIVLHIY
jgi:hypothetical protein